MLTTVEAHIAIWVTIAAQSLGGWVAYRSITRKLNGKQDKEGR